MSVSSQLFLFKHTIQIINEYKGDVPLHLFLKNYFRKNKNLGSKDRRKLRNYSYHFFRINHLLQNFSLQEKIHLADFLFEDEISEVALAFLADKFGVKSNQTNMLLDARLNDLRMAGLEIEMDKLFPFEIDLSNGINKLLFNNSFLMQPYVWTRVRQNFLKPFLEEIKNKNLNYLRKEGVTSFAFHQSAGLTELDAYKLGYFEIQDLSSQQTLQSIFSIGQDQIWWDCCAGSGGKSLLLKENFPGVKLYLSDARESILKNARERLVKINAINFSVHECNLLSQKPDFLKRRVDGIIADVPCSGSGTWSRTPEMLSYFNKTRISEFTHNQNKILQNAFEYLKPNGLLLYITCSVFKSENEDIVSSFVLQNQIEIIDQRTIAGYDMRADTMFTCLMKKGG